MFPVLLCACLLSMAACEDNTQKELERMRGEWVSKSGNTVFCLDYAQNGIGSNSCGQELLPQYRLDEEKMQFGFTIRFLSSENKQ